MANDSEHYNRFLSAKRTSVNNDEQWVSNPSPGTYKPIPCHNIPTVASCWIDFWEREQNFASFFEENSATLLPRSISKVPSERSPEAAEHMKRARRTACTKISSLGEPHQISGRAEEHGPAAKGQTHHLSTVISQVREAQLQYVSHWPGTWPVLVCLLVRRDTSAVYLYWQDPCAGERQRCASCYAASGQT